MTLLRRQFAFRDYGNVSGEQIDPCKQI